MPYIQKLAGATVISASFIAGIATANDQTIVVTPQNFPRAETDFYFAQNIKLGAFGKFFHHREPTAIDKQTVVRMNRDTLYSVGIFDLDAGPITMTMPEAGQRFMSLQVLDEDQYTYEVAYGAASHTYSKEKIGTRYVALLIRTLVDPEKPGDLDEVHKLQDAVKVDQPGGPGTFEVPNWDTVSQKKVRDALTALGTTLIDFDKVAGSKSQVDPVPFLIGVAIGWGGNPPDAATYRSFNPKENDGKTIYRLHVPADVPVDGFWSISRYNAKGFFEPNTQNAYSINNLTAKKASDGSVDIQFGGCDGKVENCLPIEAGWNYTVRMYRPQAAILEGKWEFPSAQPVR
jgi:hypothetical protein